MARYRRHRSGGRRGFGFGGLKGMIWPIAAGVADTYADSMLPVQGVGATAIGFIGHNETLKTIGLYKIGGSIGAIIPIPGLPSGGGGGLL